MPAFSLPALVLALVVSFSPAVVFQHSSPVPQLHLVPSLASISLPVSMPMVPTIPMLDINAALDALEGPFSLCNLPSPTVFSPIQFEYTLDVTKFIGTTCNDLVGTTWLSPLPSTSIPASPSHAVSALFLSVVVAFLLYALASPLHSLETILWSSSLIWPIPCRQPGTRLPHKQPSIVLPVDEPVALPEQPGIILAADEPVPLSIPDTGSMDDETHLDTPTSHHPTPRFPNRFGKGELMLIPAIPTPTGVAVFRIIAFSSAPRHPASTRDSPSAAFEALAVLASARVSPATPSAVQAPPAKVNVDTNARVCRPDRVRVVTEAPAKSSPRTRTPSAPGHLVRVPSSPTPAGAAVPRLAPMSPLRAPIAPRAPRPPPSHSSRASLEPNANAAPRGQYIHSAPRIVPGAILYQTPAVAGSNNILYSTSGASMIEHIPPRSPRPARRASTIVYHGRSEPPPLRYPGPNPSPLAHLAQNQWARALQQHTEAQLRSAHQHYLTQHRPNALAHELRAAQGRALGAR